MMKINSILLVIFLFLQGCGYKPVHLIEQGNFTITNTETTGDKKVSRYLQTNFEKFQKNLNSEYKYELEAHSIINRKTKSKNRAGVPEVLTIDIIIEIIVKENQKTVGEKIFKESLNYSNLVNKFELNQYEKIMIKDHTNKVVNKINLFISSLR